MNTEELDAIDRKLIHALQIDPRASWKSLESVVGANSGTLARRWARLSEKGLAWATGHMRDGILALLELECDFRRIDDVIKQLVKENYVHTVELCSGARNLVLMVAAPDLPRLSTILTEQLSQIEGIRRVNTHVLSEIHVDGSDWRLNDLNRDEISKIPVPSGPRPRAARHVPDDLKQIIAQEVWQNGRVSVTEISERHELKPQKVADAIATLRQNGVLRFRIDVARNATDWGISAWYFVRTPPNLNEAIKLAAKNVPEIRFSATSASRSNLLMAVWLHELSDVSRFEATLESQVRGVTILDRTVVLRSIRHMSHAITPTSLADNKVGVLPRVQVSKNDPS